MGQYVAQGGLQSVYSDVCSLSPLHFLFQHSFGRKFSHLSRLKTYLSKIIYSHTETGHLVYSEILYCT